MAEQSSSANPYIAGSPVTQPDMFFGREDVFQFIRDALIGRHQDNIIVLYGQRRTGKTSVLYQMHRHIDPRHIPILIDLQGLSLGSLSDFFWEVASTTRRALQREHRLEIPRPRREEFAQDPLSRFSEEFLPQVWDAVGDRNLLLMFDEATRLDEQVQAGKLDRQVFDLLRSLMQHNPRLDFIFSLSTRLELIHREYSVLFNVALYKEITFLDRESTTALIRQPVRDLYGYTDDAVERTLEVACGHAYYTQLLCHSLFGLWQRNPKPEVTAEDVDAVLGEVVERAIANLKFDWEESSPGERLVLACFAAVPEAETRPLALPEIQEALRNHAIPLPLGEVTGALKNLVGRELMVAASEDRYRFAVDVLRIWLHDHQRPDWVREELGEYLSALPPSAASAEPGVAGRPSDRARWLWIALGAIAAVVAALLFIPASPASVISSSGGGPDQVVESVQLPGGTGGGAVQGPEDGSATQGTTGPIAGEAAKGEQASAAPEALPVVNTFAVDKCQTAMVIPNTLDIELCVQRVEELEDSALRFNLSWTVLADSPEVGGLLKNSDVGNTNMYVTDPTGKVYLFTELGGAAKEETFMPKGETVTGWYLFPDIPKEVRTLTFVDNDLALRIEEIVLERPGGGQP